MSRRRVRGRGAPHAQTQRMQTRGAHQRPRHTHIAENNKALRTLMPLMQSTLNSDVVVRLSGKGCRRSSAAGRGCQLLLLLLRAGRWQHLKQPTTASTTAKKGREGEVDRKRAG